jgi:hypothetical protein
LFDLNNQIEEKDALNQQGIAEREVQSARLKAANDLLQNAEDLAAANALAKQTTAYNTLKTARDALTTELAALYVKDDAATASQTEIDRLLEIEGILDESEEEYTAAKNALETKQREANEKAFNKASGAAAEAAARLAEATAANKAAVAADTAATAAVTKANAEKTRLETSW